MMKITAILLLTGVLAIGSETAAQQPQSFSQQLTREEVSRVAGAVARWQMDHFETMNERRTNKQSDLTWANGVFLGALADWAVFVDDRHGLKWCREVARRNCHQPAPNRMYHADDVIVSMLYATLYELEPKFNIIAPTIARLDFQVNYPSKASLKMGEANCLDRWCWCDALYMAPPVFVRLAALTGNSRYIDHADSEFRATTDYLYDRREHLFFRDSRYFDMKEANGSKIFWGRGNGWVIGGLARMLEYLPETHPSREYYLALFGEMSARLASLQDMEGYWHPSLLDPVSYNMPETSATGLISYALWWGINNGVLDGKTYRPVAEKGWKALVRAVNTDGMVGWVQPIGADPQAITADMTEVYGAGALLLTAKEVILNIEKSK